MSSFLLVESGGINFIFFIPPKFIRAPLNLGREPLGFLSPDVALVTIYRKGDETQHASKE